MKLIIKFRCLAGALAMGWYTLVQACPLENVKKLRFWDPRYFDELPSVQSQSAEDLAQLHLQMERVRALLESPVFTPYQRDILLLRAEGYSYRDIKKILKLRVGANAVRGTFIVAQTRLAAILKGRENSPDYLLHIEEGFRPWLQYELDKRGWSFEDLLVERVIGHISYSELAPLWHAGEDSSKFDGDLVFRIRQALDEVKPKPAVLRSRRNPREEVGDWLKRELTARNWIVPSLQQFAEINGLDRDIALHYVVHGNTSRHPHPWGHQPERIANTIIRLEKLFGKFDPELRVCREKDETNGMWLIRLMQRFQLDIQKLDEAMKLSRNDRESLDGALLHPEANRNLAGSLPHRLVEYFYQLAKAQ